MHVGLLYTPVDLESKRDDSIDPHGSEQMDLTVKAIEKALITNGHMVTRIAASIDLLRDIKDIEGLEVIYNICTGITNKMQQANVVGMLEMTGIPFVGSSLSAHILGLHKDVSKRLFQSVGIPTADFQVFYTGEEPVKPTLRYPLIVKPVHEGSSLGITEDSVVHDEVELRNQVQKLFRIFNQPALVEEFIIGREFTVGVMGNDELEVLPIQEIIYDTTDGMGFMTVEIKARDAIEVKCPADINPELADRIKNYAAKAFKIIGCNEFARIDVRLDANGTPNFLEINTLPGMQPEYSDFPRVAKAGGYTYESLIEKLLLMTLTKNKEK